MLHIDMQVKWTCECLFVPLPFFELKKTIASASTVAESRPGRGVVTHVKCMETWSIWGGFDWFLFLVPYLISLLFLTSLSSSKSVAAINRLVSFPCNVLNCHICKPHSRPLPMVMAVTVTAAHTYTQQMAPPAAMCICLVFMKSFHLLTGSERTTELKNSHYGNGPLLCIRVLLIHRHHVTPVPWLSVSQPAHQQHSLSDEGGSLGDRKYTWVSTAETLAYQGGLKANYTSACCLSVCLSYYLLHRSASLH